MEPLVIISYDELAGSGITLITGLSPSITSLPSTGELKGKKFTHSEAYFHYLYGLEIPAP